MSKSIKAKIDIEINDIEVGNRYFSFNYRIWADGELSQKDEYHDSYSDLHSASSFKDILEKGHAVSLVLKEVAEQIY